MSGEGLYPRNQYVYESSDCISTDDSSSESDTVSPFISQPRYDTEPCIMQLAIAVYRMAVAAKIIVENLFQPWDW